MVEKDKLNNKKKCKLKPDYCDNVVVGIINNGEFDWYVLYEEFCFMDQAKLRKAYFENVPSIIYEYDETFRYGIDILDENTKDLFLEKVEEYKISDEELKEYIYSEPDFDERLSFSPVILINFDEKIFYSYYPEPGSHELYVPDNWIGKYVDFEKKVPKKRKYWLTDKNEDIIVTGGRCRKEKKSWWKKIKR